MVADRGLDVRDVSCLGHEFVYLCVGFQHFEISRGGLRSIGLRVGFGVVVSLDLFLECWFSAQIWILEF